MVIQPLPTLSTSGARIIEVSVDAADAFLAREGQRPLDETWIALAAVQDQGPMIGVATLGASSADVGRVAVAVAPAWRRLNLGTDLLHRLAVEAPRWNLGQLRMSYPTTAVAADHFVDACGLPAVRGVVNGVITAVLVFSPVSPR